MKNPVESNGVEHVFKSHKIRETFGEFNSIQI